MGKPIQICESIFVESRNGIILTKDSEIVKIWTEFCKELFNYPINPDENILNYDRGVCVEENLPILKSEVEHVIRSLKKGKSTGIDNILSETIINGGSQIVITMNLLCQNIWYKKEWIYT